MSNQMGGIIVKVQSEKNDCKPNTQIHDECVSEVCERHVSSADAAGADATDSDTTSVSDIHDVDLQECKKKIENDAQYKLMKMNNENPSFEKGGRMLVEIMSSGAREFKQKTGREMTYSEMRDMYG
jgi:hypothetical protein